MTRVRAPACTAIVSAAALVVAVACGSGSVPVDVVTSDREGGSTGADASRNTNSDASADASSDAEEAECPPGTREFAPCGEVHAHCISRCNACSESFLTDEPIPYACDEYPAGSGVLVWQ